MAGGDRKVFITACRTLGMRKKIQARAPTWQVAEFAICSLQFQRVCSGMARVFTRGFTEEVRSWRSWTKAGKRVFQNQPVSRQGSAGGVEVAASRDRSDHRVDPMWQHSEHPARR